MQLQEQGRTYLRGCLSDMLGNTRSGTDAMSLTILETDLEMASSRLRRAGPTIRELVWQVAAETGVPAFAIIGRSKTQKASSARQEVMRRAYATGTMSAGRIARRMGRDTSTIFHALYHDAYKARKRERSRWRRAQQ